MTSKFAKTYLREKNYTTVKPSVFQCTLHFQKKKRCARSWNGKRDSGFRLRHVRWRTATKLPPMIHTVPDNPADRASSTVKWTSRAFQQLQFGHTKSGSNKDILFYRGKSVVLLNKDNKIVSGFSQNNDTLIYFILMTTCFGHLTIIMPPLQNLQ